jgi:hypothetical protein
VPSISLQKGTFLELRRKKHLKAAEELNDVFVDWLLMTAEQSAALGHNPKCLADSYSTDE